MSRLAGLYGSTVGKKVLMALSGVVLFGFVFGHMLGNLKVLQGAESFNGYAEFLRDVGYPAVPHSGLLWMARIGLLAAVAVHIAMAAQLWRVSGRARPRGYARSKDLSFSYASRTMRWGGVILLLFIVYHILHFTTGQAHRDFVPGNPYQNFLVAFQSPLVLAFYLVAQVALALHLYHGVWSVFQTLGLSHERYDRLRRPFAGAFAGLVFVGFVTPPILVFLGVVG